MIITQIYSDLVRKVNIWLFPALTSTRCFDEIRVAPDWVKIWEVSIGVYWCPYLGGGAEAKGPRSSHLMVGRVIAGTVPLLDP